MNKIILILLLILPSLVLILFFTRLLTLKEMDDVSPEIPCSEKYLKKSDILWIIPKYNNKPVSENKTWCNYILSLNKTLGLHGVIHKFEEFKTNRNQEYLEEGVDIFEQCFSFKPKIFKPPQLKISTENKELIKKNNMKLKVRYNQLIHKAYHCNDAGKIKNWVVDLF